VGVPSRSLVLGKHSGRNALKTSLRDLGYDPSDADLAECYRRVTALADQSKQVRQRDLVAIAHEVMRRGTSANSAVANGAPSAA
jgi:2-isopropylmalate synthase